MKLTLAPEIYAVCQMSPTAAIPNWGTEGSFFSICKTDDELSIVCEQKNVPHDIKSEKDWRLLKFEGPLDFSLTGILASVANPLAQSKVSIFAISTFDTDYVMVKESLLAKAISCLESAGFTIDT